MELEVGALTCAAAGKPAIRTARPPKTASH
jgi:hypothetical protein